MKAAGTAASPHQGDRAPGGRVADPPPLPTPDLCAFRYCDYAGNGNDGQPPSYPAAFGGLASFAASVENASRPRPVTAHATADAAR